MLVKVCVEFEEQYSCIEVKLLERLDHIFT